MKPIKDLLNDADPVRQEPPISKARRDAMRAAIVAAASARQPQDTNPSPRFMRKAMISVVAIVIVILGVRFWPHMGSETHAFVRLEVKLAEDSPGPGLHEVLVPSTGRTIYLHEEIVVDNGDVKNVYVSRDENGRPAVSFSLTQSGANKMAVATENNLGKPMAVLIDGVVVMAPTVKSRITDNGQITGLTKEEVERIVNGMK